MSDEFGTVIFVVGSNGAGKTELVKSFLRLVEGQIINIDKDILADSIKSYKRSYFSSFLSRLFNFYKVDEESLYDATLKLVAYNMLCIRKSNNTAIVEGNFGKRLSKDMLTKHFENLNNFNFILLHITCSDEFIQYNRVLDREDSKDCHVTAGTRDYNLTKFPDFKKFRKFRLREEEDCITRMANYMQIIRINNDSNDINSINQLALKLKQDIGARVASSSHASPIRGPESYNGTDASIKNTSPSKSKEIFFKSLQRPPSLVLEPGTTAAPKKSPKSPRLNT